MKISRCQYAEAARLLAITVGDLISDQVCIFKAVVLKRDPRVELLERWKS